MRRNIIDPGQLEEVKARYEKWWDKKADGMIIGAAVRNREPSIPEPKYSIPTQYTVHMLPPVEGFLDAIEYRLSRFSYIGDAYPYVNLDLFGPGLLVRSFYR